MLIVCAVVGMIPWGVPASETIRFVGASIALVLVPGWVLVHPVRRRLQAAERFVLVPILGGLATGAAHYLWNIHADGVGALPGTDVFLAVWCVGFAVAAVALRVRSGPVPRARSDAKLWITLALLIAPVPPTVLFATPNGRATEHYVESDMDEFLHYAIVGEFLRPGPVQLPWLAGYPMPPYQYVEPSLRAAYVRAAGVDPIRLATRLLPIPLVGLACAAGYVLARRLLRSHMAALLAALSLVYAGDYFTVWGFVLQAHSVVAYLALAAGVTLLDVARGSRCRGALVLGAFSLALIFQLKTPLYVTCAFALVAAAAIDLARRRDATIFWIGVLTAAFTLPLATGYLTSATSNPLGFFPGEAYAHIARQLPAPWDALGALRPVAFVVGSVLMLTAAANLKLLGLGWMRRALRRGVRPGSAALFLLSAVAIGTVLVGSVYVPTNLDTPAPFWFLQHPLLMTAQLMFGAGIAEWLRRPGRLSRRAGCVLLALPALCVAPFLPTMIGEDPTLFPRAEVDCARWLLEGSDPADRVLARETALSFPVFSLRPSVYTHVPSVAGEKDNGVAPEAYLAEMLAVARERRAKANAWFEAPTAGDALQLATELEARWVYLGPGEELAFEPESALGAAVTTCGRGGRLYRVP